MIQMSSMQREAISNISTRDYLALTNYQNVLFTAKKKEQNYQNVIFRAYKKIQNYQNVIFRLMRKAPASLIFTGFKKN